MISMCSARKMSRRLLITSRVSSPSLSEELRVYDCTSLAHTLIATIAIAVANWGDPNRRSDSLCHLVSLPCISKSWESSISPKEGLSTGVNGVNGDNDPDSDVLNTERNLNPSHSCLGSTLIGMLYGIGIGIGLMIQSVWLKRAPRNTRMGRRWDDIL